MKTWNAISSQIHKKSPFFFRATILVVRQKGVISMGIQASKEADLREFAILNFSAQESLQDEVTAHVAGSMKKFLETTVATFGETVVHFRTSLQTRVEEQESINKLYLDTMRAFWEYQQASLHDPEEPEREVSIMAEEITKQEPVQEAAAPAKEDAKKDPVEEYKEALTEKFQKLAEEKKAFWQDKNAELHRPYSPTYKPNGYSSLSAAILMQAQVERGLKDARWISASELKKIPSVSKKSPDIEPTKIIVQNKDKKHVTLNMYNYSDLNGVSEKDNYCKTDDWAKTFAENIKFGKDSNIWNVAYHASKAIYDMQHKFKSAEQANAVAGHAADKEAYAKACEKYRPQEAERKSAMESSAYDVAENDKKFEKMTGEKKFFHDMAKAYQEDTSKKDYVVKASKAALLRGEKKENVAKFIKKFAPQAAFDEARKSVYHDTSYSKYILEHIDHDKTFKAELKNAKAAQR